MTRKEKLEINRYFLIDYTNNSYLIKCYEHAKLTHICSIYALITYGFRVISLYWIINGFNAIRTNIINSKHRLFDNNNL